MAARAFLLLGTLQERAILFPHGWNPALSTLAFPKQCVCGPKTNSTTTPHRDGSYFKPHLSHVPGQHWYHPIRLLLWSLFLYVGKSLCWSAKWIQLSVNWPQPVFFCETKEFPSDLLRNRLSFLNKPNKQKLYRYTGQTTDQYHLLKGRYTPQQIH